MNIITRWLARFLHSPLLWGGIVAALYYGGIYGGIINHPMLLRFTAGHSVEYIVVVFFFVGAAALVIKAIEISSQRRMPEQALLGPVPQGGQSVEEVADLIPLLADAPARLQDGFLIRRMRGLLEHIHRTGKAETLDGELKYLADIDAMRAQHGYAFVRVIIWAIPILGLLGTVIGITSVFAHLDIKHFDASLPMVLNGLQVAFDTTGLALAMSMLLMFGQYFVDRSEQALLAEVDARVNSELVGRFQSDEVGSDPQLGPMRRLVETVVQATERLVARQAEIWRGTIDVAEERHRQLTTTSGKQLESALAGALDNTLKTHATTIAATERQLAEQSMRQWAGVQQALLKSAEATARQHAEMTRQSELLLKVVEATGQIAGLEQTLNRNLSALSNARSFDDTLVTLSATVQLLSARLGQSTGEQRMIQLSPPSGSPAQTAAAISAQVPDSPAAPAAAAIKARRTDKAA
jgi:biopolymer transport protein ExbB/TolQ